MTDDPEKKRKLTVAQVLGLEKDRAPLKQTEMGVHHTPMGTETRLQYTKEMRDWMAREQKRKEAALRVPKAHQDAKTRNLKKYDFSMYIRKDSKTKDDDFEK